jgi:hypothetical protein
MKQSKRPSKKNLEIIIASIPGYEVFFFDESRFGTHSKIGYGWFKKGSRTAVNKKLGFKSFYLYTAASPKTGEDFTLVMSYIGTEALNVYLQEMSLWLGDRNACMIMDQAGWHKSAELVIPENIKILYLPAYSPELNPIERLWQYIKDNVLKNKVYDNLTILEKESVF